MEWEDHGTPTIGLYAQDGLWDEDESFETNNSNVASSAASTIDKKRLSTKTGSSKGRSRSGTVTTPLPREEDRSGGGGWNWGKKAVENPSPASTQASSTRVVKEKKSKSMLRGKGRRGELSVVVAKENVEEPVSILHSV